MKDSWIQTEKRVVGEKESVILSRGYSGNARMPESKTKTTPAEIRENNDMDTCNGTMYAYIETTDGWPVKLNKNNRGACAEVEVEYEYS